MSINDRTCSYVGFLFFSFLCFAFVAVFFPLVDSTSNWLHRTDIAGGGGTAPLACDINTETRTITKCEGSMACESVYMYHYSSAWFDYENGLVTNTKYCSYFGCGGSGQDDNWIPYCEWNW